MHDGGVEATGAAAAAAAYAEIYTTLHPGTADDNRRLRHQQERQEQSAAAADAERTTRTAHMRQSRDQAASQQRAQMQHLTMLEQREARAQQGKKYQHGLIAHLAVDGDLPLILPHQLPARVACGFCGALRWPGETPSICCSGGKIQVPPLTPPPPFLRQLFEGDDIIAREFRANARTYNAAFRMASSTAPVSLQLPSGPQALVLSGRCYHKIGALQPLDGGTANFAQIYILDGNAATQRRQALFANMTLQASILDPLRDLLEHYNSFVRTFRRAMDPLQPGLPPLDNRCIVVTEAGVPDIRTWNAPTAEEVAAFSPEATAARGTYDVVVRLKRAAGDTLQIVPDISAAHEPLLFPLLFPYGELGWQRGLLRTVPAVVAGRGGRGSRGRGRGGEAGGRGRGRGAAAAAEASDDGGSENDGDDAGETEAAGNDDNVRGPRLNITSLEFMRFRLHDRRRDGDSNHLLRAGRLLEEWACDRYATHQQQVMRWVARDASQKKLRAELYSGLIDAAADGASTSQENIGRRIILPATITGSPRWFERSKQDAMAVSRVLGKADLFITMTCNPKWPEIVNELLPGQTAVDRPDVVQRVFLQKANELVKLFRDGSLFGKCIALDDVIEWQKRKLPHMHLLGWLASVNKPHNADDFDRIVCAEIPPGGPPGSPRADLRALVLAHMIHNPCSNAAGPVADGASCARYRSAALARPIITAAAAACDKPP
jgi:hypothetical protein